MRTIDILIIAGCLGVGYWIVSSIMGKGVDPKDGRDGKPTGNARPPSRPDAVSPAPPQLPFPSVPPTPPRPRTSGSQPWHVVLDIPRDASSRDIEAARRRRIAAAEAAGDSFEVERVRRAAEEALKQAR